MADTARPRITEDTLAFDRLLAMPEDTLGGAYARWMRGHEFTPDERYPDDARSAHLLGLCCVFVCCVL
jgi:ubiquinone biosynthesis protein Coq4